MIECLLSLLLFHPVHETLAEVEWNPQTGRVEIALRLDVLDEQWIARHHRASPADSSSARPHFDDSAWRLNYLRNRFICTVEQPVPRKPRPGRKPGPGQRVASEDQTTAPHYHWIGRKQQGAHVWWFFEVEMPNHEPPRWISQSLLFDRDDRYTHRVVVLGSKPLRTLELSPDRASAELSFPRDES